MPNGDSFDLQPGMLEVDKQRGLEACNVEVAGHPGAVGFVAAAWSAEALGRRRRHRAKEEALA